MRDLTRGPLSKHIIFMAIPIAVGMLVQTLYHLVDLYFVSGLGEVALAGVSAAGSVMILVMAFTQVLNVGAMAIVSHAVGREDRSRANLAFNQAVVLAGLLSVVTLIGGYAGIARWFVATLGADSGTTAAGLSYLYWFLPALALQFALAVMGAALRGTGIVKPTMIVQLATLLLNTILTPILITGWGTGHPMGVAGAGLASSISVTVGLILMTLYFFRLERYVSFAPALWRPRWEVLRKILSVGLPAGGEFALMFVYMAVCFAVIRSFGAAAQAGFGAGMRLTQAVFLPAMAISFAAPAIAGQNFGARLADRVRGTFRTATAMSIGIMFGLTLFCQWRPEWLVAPFSSDPEVLQVATQFLRIISWNFVPTGLIFTCSGMFQAMGNTLPALASTATRLITFVIPVAWLSSRSGFRIEHVWYVSVATVALQAVLSLCLLAWQFRRRLQFEGDIAA